MRQIEVLHTPRGRIIGLMPFPFAKENQFEAVPFTCRPGHITRVIPPFRAKIFMLEVIPGKLVGVTGKSLAILEAAPQQRENTKRQQPHWQRYPAHPDTMT